MTLRRLDEICDVFQSVEPAMRLELLLDYARKLPPLPERFRAARDAGANRVPECVTPVFLFSELNEDGKLSLYIDVAEEAPTVAGLMSIVLESVNGEPAEAAAALPGDLLVRLGLHQAIGPQRTLGFAGIAGRIRRMASDAATREASS